MTRRRIFGAVRKLPSGRWQAHHTASNGGRLVAPHTFATKADANRWLSRVEADKSRGLWVDPKAGAVRLDEYSWAWLEGKVRLAPRTREIYSEQLRLHILPTLRDDMPALGDVWLSKLTPELIRAWYAVVTETHSASAAAKAYTRLRQILSQAVDDDRILKNPCRIDGGGTERSPEQRFATLEELYRLSDAVPDCYRALVLIAGLAGLRQGELFGLRRRDIDLCAAQLVVRQKRYRLTSGEVIEDEPKTEAGKRKVALPASVLPVLHKHLASHTLPGSAAYVFTSPEGKPLDRTNFRGRVWLPALAEAGLEGLRFHDLRHTAGTLAARTGATTKELMARLGHASPRAALIYQHASEERDRQIAERLSAMTVDAGLASNAEESAPDADHDDDESDR